MRHRRAKNALVVALGLALASLGVYNIVLKATWSLMDDGVFWKTAPQGLVAARIAAGGPGDRAGVRAGDILLAVDEQEVLSQTDLETTLGSRSVGETVTYRLLRAEEMQQLVVPVEPLPQGNVSAFYYLSLVGFFSLIVGTVVMLRRPADRSSMHFYGVCVLFFLVYSTSYTGKLTGADWALFWADYLARLFLPVVFLHFCLTFPERRLRAQRLWLVPALYMPALVLAGAAIMSQALFAAGEETGALWSIVAAIDRIQPLYFALFFAMAFAVLVDSYRRTRSLTARRQIKWLVWGTGGGVVPFLAFYALPFALGRQPGMAMELAGYVPLALIPLSLAYAVVKHRLMDVELIVRRALGFVLAMAVLVSVALLTAGLTDVLWEEPHNTAIALLSAIVAVLLFTPVKSRVQEALERLFYRERYSSRKALVRLSEDLNADLDLERMSERLLQGVGSALGLREIALFLPDGGPDEGYVPFKARGVPRSDEARLSDEGLISRLQAGEPVDVESKPEEHPALARLGLGWLFPCRVKGEVIAVLGVGRKDGLDPLNSEEVDTLKTLAAQAATAIMNGRLYRSLSSQAEELRELKDYNENVLESLDSGIVVLSLEGEITSWNRAMETLYGLKRHEARGRLLSDVLPNKFMEALRGSLDLGNQGEIAHIYKLHLESSDGRSLMVNASVAPFQSESGPAEQSGTILIIDDVTARVRLEEQLQHTEKMASVGLLAAGVAHEVNTPLAGISSYTQLLRGHVQEEEQRGELLDKIEKQSFRAAKIINSLLNFSRSSGTEFEQVDVNKTLVDVLSLVEHQLTGSRIRVRKELAEELPPVRGNENRIQQVFFNLILNARDAMPRGGWLTLATSADDDTVVVEVKDTGHGIRRDHIRKIYDPFFTTKGIGRGTGLGLSVSYGIIQEHGGAIFVDSTPGQGTKFQVALPALVVSEAAQQG